MRSTQRATGSTSVTTDNPRSASSSEGFVRKANASTRQSADLTKQEPARWPGNWSLESSGTVDFASSLAITVTAP